MKRAESRAMKESLYICDFEDIIIQSKAIPQLIPSEALLYDNLVGMSSIPIYQFS